MSFGKISRLLIANRGEIACRISRSAKLFGCHTIGVYSDADKHALHVNLADEAYCIGPAAVQQSYLNIPRLIQVAKASRADAIHPGYGFLSESVEFAKACLDANLIFVGPPVSAIRDMGIKNKSKAIMSAAGVPVIEGYHGDDQSDDRLRREAEKIGYPIMIKAVRGGGGKGMRMAHSASEFDEQLASARSESLKAFNDDGMLIEKFIVRPRHVEVQVFGDYHGNYVYLWERDCSVQRRHQKILEEAPAPGLSPDVRRAMGEAAVAAARAVNYVGAGTVEFVVDAKQNFYFMEMNTRLQVEHPVTEAITNTDLVDWQLRVASGEPLPLTDQKQIPLFGHAFEARIYAEDCSDPSHMMPAAGQLGFHDPPPGASHYTRGTVRVDTGVLAGDSISVHYDPMIAKLVAWGSNREEARSRLYDALANYRIAGVPTNVAFLRQLVAHPNVISGEVHTGFIDQHIDDLRPPSTTSHRAAACSAALWTCLEPQLRLANRKSSDPMSALSTQVPGFRINLPCTRTVRLTDLHSNQSSTHTRVTYPRGPDDIYKVEIFNDQSPDSTPIDSVSIRIQPQSVVPRTRGLQDYSFQVEIQASDETWSLSTIDLVHEPTTLRLHIFDQASGEHFQFGIPLPDYASKGATGESGSSSAIDASVSISPMPGVIERLFVSVGDQVETGQALLTLIAMKMEYTVRAQMPGRVRDVTVTPGATVASGQVLVELDAVEET